MLTSILYIGTFDKDIPMNYTQISCFVNWERWEANFFNSKKNNNAYSMDIWMDLSGIRNLAFVKTINPMGSPYNESNDHVQFWNTEILFIRYFVTFHGSLTIIAKFFSVLAAKCWSRNLIKLKLRSRGRVVLRQEECCNQKVLTSNAMWNFRWWRTFHC